MDKQKALVPAVAALASVLLSFSASAQVGADNPTGPSGDQWQYVANAKRSIVDLSVPGGAGKYSLTFARTLNSRFVAGVASEFGSAGNWRHSYQWSIKAKTDVASGNYPSSYDVSYPDGRQVVFTTPPFPLPAGTDPYARGPRGIRERFQQLSGNDPTNCYLLLPDGGKIHFEATRTGTTFTYAFREIIDPYGPGNNH